MESTQGQLFSAPQLSDRVPAGKIDTSIEAFERIAKFTRTRDQRIVLRAIFNAGPRGMIGDEIEVQERMSHQTASARCNDLYRAGLIQREGAKRLTRTGSPAKVWTLTEWALKQMAG